jgi:uncharacterized protein YfdQ (DUF2303 family)
MEAQAIEKLQDMVLAAYEGLQQDMHCPSVVLPKGYELMNLEHLDHVRYRFRGQVSTGALGQFAKVCLDTGQANNGMTPVCFVDAEEMAATAIFNIGNQSEPGHCDHTCVLQMKKTPEYAALLRLDGDMKSQADFAEWLEEWRDFVSCHAGTFDNMKGMTIVKAVASVRNMKSVNKLEVGTREGHHATGSQVLASSELDDADNFPSWICFNCKPYEDLAERQIWLRVSSTHGGGDKPRLVARILRKNKVLEEIATEFTKLVEESLMEGQVKVYMGTFKKV